jgi:hypothetical protein
MSQEPRRCIWWFKRCHYQQKLLQRHPLRQHFALISIEHLSSTVERQKIGGATEEPKAADGILCGGLLDAHAEIDGCLRPLQTHVISGETGEMWRSHGSTIHRSLIFCD